MTTINMLRGGKAHGPGNNQYMFNMYPRPDNVLSNMAETMGWENYRDSAHMVHRLNLCDCWSGGAVQRAKKADSSTDKCCLEVGDEIPLVWIPNKFTLEGVTLQVNNGITGVTASVRRYKVENLDDLVIADASLVGTILVDSDLGPLPSTAVTQQEIDDLDCGERIDLDRYCNECKGEGCMFEHWYASRILIGGCSHEAQYLSLVITALPEDFDCSKCCLDISLGARVRFPRQGD